MLAELVELLSVCSLFVCCNCQYPLTSWTLLNATMPYLDKNPLATYNQNSYYSDCIWVFGGNDIDDLYCFNITSEEFGYWDTLSSSYGTNGQSSGPGSFVQTDGINDYLYWISNSGYLWQYQLNNKTATLLTSVLVDDDFRLSCILEHPNDENIFLMVDLSTNNNNNLAVYSKVNNNVTFGNDLYDNSVYRSTCAVINSYFYVFGGWSTTIQKLDISSTDINVLTTNSWIYVGSMNSLLNDSSCDLDNDWDNVEAANTFTYDNLVYIIGGLDTGIDDEQCIIAFDPSDESITYVGDFPIGISRYGLALAGIGKNNKQVYTFGGCTNDCTELDRVYKSNVLTSTTQPPSSIPSSIPTNFPSTIPTANPTREPSLNPSRNPSGIPTMIPSAIPTTIPTKIPTFMNNNFNYTAFLEIILYSNQLNESILEQDSNYIFSKNLIAMLKEASVQVRYDLMDVNDIDVIISTFENFNSTNTNGDNNNNSSYKYATLIGFDVSINVLWLLEQWINDISFVIVEFNSNLESIWSDFRIEFIDVVLDSPTTTKAITTTTATSTMATSSTALRSTTTTTASMSTMVETERNTTRVRIATDDGRLDSPQVTEWSYYSVIFIVVIGVVVIISGVIHTRYKHNELFRWSKMTVIITQFLDVVSDIFFAMQVYLSINFDSSNKTDVISDLIIFLLSILFILLPIFISYGQLHKEMLKWAIDIETRGFVSAWIQQHLRSLYGMCIMLGSAFTAVELCNTYLFSLSVFSMGLNRRQKAIFKNERVYSTVLFENIPQVILQITYSILTRSFSEVTVIAGIFSILSIMLSVFEHASVKMLLNIESTTIISIEVKSRGISQMSRQKFKKFSCHRSIITNEMHKVLDVDYRLIELLQPIQTKDGVRLTFHIRSGAKNVVQLVKEDAASGDLAKVMHATNVLFFFPFVVFLFFLFICFFFTKYQQAFARSWESVDGCIRRNELQIGKIETKELLPENKDNRYDNNDNADAVIRMGPTQALKPKNENGLSWLNNTSINPINGKTVASAKATGIEMRDIGVLSTVHHTDNGNNMINNESKKDDNDDELLYADGDTHQVNDHEQEVLILEALKSQDGNKTATYGDEGRNQEHETGCQQ